MPTNSDLGLLGLLAAKDNSAAVLTVLAAKAPAHEPPSEDAKAREARLNDALQRINQLAGADPRKSNPLSQRPAQPAATGAPSAAASTPDVVDEFVPIEPVAIRDAGLTDSEVEALIMKYLLSRGDCTGREIADQIRIPFILLDPLLRQLKFDQMLVYRGSAPMNDYVYQLTDLGRERARRFMDHCTYYGSAPVSLIDYILSVKAQSLEKQHPSADDLKHAFEDILVSDQMLRRLGPAINSGRGLFLFGSAGNGKTTVAERVTRAFGQFIWIPRAIGVDGEIIRLFDPVNHEECPLPQNSGLLDQSRIDRRWVRIRRPTIVVGGELTMDSLEVTLNRSTGISEAPLQLKSNCGTLVIDDFGRQKMSTDTLLNRWIVPLEKRFDYLNLPNGKKIQVPFDQLIVFSTNLEPKDLVDEAFLRRIPYKIQVGDPTESEFIELLEILAERLEIRLVPGAAAYVVQRHYKGTGRHLRFCHPRDLLFQIVNQCAYERRSRVATPQDFDRAVMNYFGSL